MTTTTTAAPRKRAPRKPKTGSTIVIDGTIVAQVEHHDITEPVGTAVAIIEHPDVEAEAESMATAEPVVEAALEPAVDLSTVVAASAVVSLNFWDYANLNLATVPRSRSGLPILNCVKITLGGGLIRLQAFDYETALDMSWPAETIGASTFLVSRTRLGATISAAGVGLSMSARRSLNTALTVDGNGKATLTLHNGAELFFDSDVAAVVDYPRMPDGAPADAEVATFAPGALWNLSNTVAAAASGDETLPLLTAVHLVFGEDMLHAEATDRYRLHLDDIPKGGALVGDVLVKAKWLRTVARLVNLKESVTVQIVDAGSASSPQRQRLSITAGTTVFTTQLVEGDYPPVARLVPTDAPLRFSAERQDLLTAFNVAKIMGEKNTPVTVEVTEGVVMVRTPASNWGLEAATDLDVVTGTELVANYQSAFNSGFLVDAITVMGGERIQMNQWPGKPALFTRADGSGPKILLMPIRFGGV